eukprot:SAG31_NODE_5519_length_2482_cov_2.359211_2_plen_220_part_00
MEKVHATRAANSTRNADVLFYIAYLRDIEDPISGRIHPCKNGDCLEELQIQLIVVFTGKTIGKQFANTVKPFVYKTFMLAKQNKLTQKFMKAMPHAVIDLASKIAESTGLVDEFVNLEDAIKECRDPIEKEAMFLPFAGTFDDFNDRVIQFGYIVLFAPAFPLAPLFAFINNVIEIRMSGFKLCHGYQRPVCKVRRERCYFLVFVVPTIREIRDFYREM